MVNPATVQDFVIALPPAAEAGANRGVKSRTQVSLLYHFPLWRINSDRLKGLIHCYHV